MPDAPSPEHRRRLLDGIGRAVAAKGFAETTISDIVREAAVSRRTFYEHFETKADCLIALFEAAAHQALQVLTAAIDRDQPWQTQLQGAVEAYLACLACNPALLRTLFIDILGLGPRGLAARRQINREMADFIRTVANTPRAGQAAGSQLSEAMAMAVVGGIHELILACIERDEAASLAALASPVCAFVRAAVQGPRGDAG